MWLSLTLVFFFLFRTALRSAVLKMAKAENQLTYLQVPTHTPPSRSIYNIPI